MSNLSQETVWRETPPEAMELINEPLTPFEQLVPYNGEPGIYELDDRPETGYDVVLLFHTVGEQQLSTRLVKLGHVVAEVETPADKGLDRLHHLFPNIDAETSELVFQRAA